MNKEPGGLFFEILEQLLKSCFPILDKISWDINTLEEFIYQGQQQEAIQDILRIKKMIKVKPIRIKEIKIPELKVPKMRYKLNFDLIYKSGDYKS